MINQCWYRDDYIAAALGALTVASLGIRHGPQYAQGVLQLIKKQLKHHDKVTRIPVEYMADRCRMKIALNWCSALFTGVIEHQFGGSAVEKSSHRTVGGAGRSVLLR